MEQLETIKKATKAYLLPLNEPKYLDATLRFSVLLLVDGDLVLLWPNHDENGEAVNLLAYQNKSSYKCYPAYHFCAGGHGRERRDLICRMLHKINPSLDFRDLEHGKLGLITDYL